MADSDKKPWDEQVLDALRSRGAYDDEQACEACSHTEWQLGEGWVEIISQMPEKRAAFGTGYYPSVAVICRNCGNTHIHNLRILDVRMAPVEDEPDDGESAESGDD